MVDGKKLFVLYLKIFIIILLIGIILPYLIDVVLNLIVLIHEKNQPGNSIFVFKQSGYEKSYIYYIIKLLEKIIDFS
jgi:hypothetical protein